MPVKSTLGCLCLLLAVDEWMGKLWRKVTTSDDYTINVLDILLCSKTTRAAGLLNALLRQVLGGIPFDSSRRIGVVGCRPDDVYSTRPRAADSMHTAVR